MALQRDFLPLDLLRLEMLRLEMLQAKNAPLLGMEQRRDSCGESVVARETARTLLPRGSLRFRECRAHKPSETTATDESR